MQQEEIFPNNRLKSVTTQQRKQSDAYFYTEIGQLSINGVNFKMPRHLSNADGYKYKCNKVPQILKQTLKKQGAKLTRQRRASTITGLFKQVKYDVLGNISNLNKCQLCEIVSEQMLSLSNCQHIFCVNCLNTYVNYKIRVHETIVCPQENCNVLANQDGQIFKMLSPYIISKYKQQKLWRESQGIPNVRMCPRKDCQTGLIDMLATPPKCRNCNRTFCKQCQLETHEGKCLEAFETLFKNWKRCGNCKMFIEKAQGCNHITCKCSYQFCYVCGSTWNNKHYQCGNPYAFQQPNYGLRYLYIFLFIILIPLIILIEILLSIVIIIVGPFFGLFVFCCMIQKEETFRSKLCPLYFCASMPLGIALGFYGLYKLHRYLYQNYSRIFWG